MVEQFRREFRGALDEAAERTAIPGQDFILATNDDTALAVYALRAVGDEQVGELTA